MKKNVPKLLYVIFLIALIFRIYKLDTFPIGFHSDEARVAWNSLSILKTGQDDRGNTLALYYNTFGDYRPTGIFYFTIPSLLIFGNTEFAVRFPSALFGALTVFPLYLFVFEITKNKKLAIIAALFLTISPWHIEVSRATSEVVISTFFALYSCYFLRKTLDSRKSEFVILTAISALISYLLYHAIRLTAPLFFFTILIYYFKEKRNLISIISFVFIIFLTILFSLTPEARARFNQVTIFSDPNTLYEVQRLKDETLIPTRMSNLFENKKVVYIKRFLIEYSSYFSGSFLWGEEARPYRYTTPGVGLVSFVGGAFFIIGIIAIIKNKYSSLPLLLLLIAPIPAALTTEDAPNLHRAFFMAIFFVIIEAVGYNYISTIKNLKFTKTLITIFLVLNFFYFSYMYFNHSFSHKPFIKEFELDGSSYRNIGTKELVLKIEEVKDNYDKIILTNSTDDPYPWYAFFNHKDPQDFNQFAKTRANGPWQYENILFSQDRCPSDDYFTTESEKNILVIDAGYPLCDYEAKIKDGLKIKAINKIVRSDKSEVYVFLEKSN